MTTHGDQLFQMGGVPVASAEMLYADAYLVTREGAYEPYKYWLRKWKRRKHLSTLAAAYDATVGGRNDVIYLSPDTHVQTAAVTSAAAITWAKSNTHLIGAGAYLPGANPAVVIDDGAAGTGHFNPFFSVTGDYNMFRNIRFTSGNATNTNLNFLRIQGSGNLFENCFFDGPMSTTLADLATYDHVIVGGVGNVFRNCIFGTMWKTRGAANNLLKFQRSVAGLAARGTIFEDCIFQSNVDSDTVTHIDENSEGGGMYGPQYFRNCHLVFRWSDHADKVTIAIRHGTAGLTGQLHFDSRCSIWGATDVCAGTVGRQAVIWGHSGETTTTIGLAIQSAD